MEIIKDNIIYESFKTSKELKERILEFILNAKADKILYKGSPFDINYKLLKKMIEEDIKLTPEEVREIYKNIVEKSDNKNCLIYKK